MKNIISIFNLMIILIFLYNSFFYKILGNSNNDLKLKNLILSEEGLVPDFQSDIYEYEIVVSNQINKIGVEAIQEDLNNKIEIIGNDNLKAGKNKIAINVVSSEGNKRVTYNINVIKTDNKELINTNLETLAIENILLNPPFENDILSYNIEVSNQTSSLNILAIPENEESNIKIIGSDKLVNGNNTIQIIVTSPNQLVQRIYKINAYKRNTEEDNLYKKQENINNEKLEEIFYLEGSIYAAEKTKLQINNEKVGYKLNVKTIIFVLLSFLVIIFVIIKNRKFGRK